MAERDPNLVLAIVMGLRKGLRLCHGMRRQLTEPEQFKVGAAIAEQLEKSNYEIRQGPVAAGHGQSFSLLPGKPGGRA